MGSSINRLLRRYHRLTQLERLKPFILIASLNVVMSPTSPEIGNDYFLNNKFRSGLRLSNTIPRSIEFSIQSKKIQKKKITMLLMRNL